VKVSNNNLFDVFVQHQESRVVYKIFDKRDKVSYVNIVFLVSDVKVFVDAELVDVRDDGHVRNAILRFYT
jgi:hypothetical protein